MPAILIHCFAAFQLLAAPATATDTVNEAVVRVAQAAPATSELTLAGRHSNGAAGRLSAAQKREAVLVKQKAKLRATYNKQLGEVDKLKRARASWRRDRSLREQKARSQKTAIALQSADTRLRAQRTLVVRERKATVRAVEKELALSPSSVRTRYLRGVLKSAKRGLAERAKKISMPDLELDEFADPEELLEQIELIERAEAKLALQESSLQRRAKHYAHMDALRSKRNRAEELGAFDNDNVRRSTGRTSTGASRQGQDDGNESGLGVGGGAESPSDSSAPPEADTDFSGPSFEASSVVLSDVVDSGTQDALRRAHRSSSPRTKAAAARRAHKQVQDRLTRLKSSKARIRAHLKRYSK